mmetsp:Transcript_34390/g.105354  ORF Transcript_34390/g.105354 Transcript_34390/m.105354 type:complete len:391 (-) Transcript_34390:7-1179(-)
MPVLGSALPTGRPSPQLQQAEPDAPARRRLRRLHRRGGEGDVRRLGEVKHQQLGDGVQQLLQVASALAAVAAVAVAAGCVRLFLRRPRLEEGEDWHKELAWLVSGGDQSEEAVAAGVRLHLCAALRLGEDALVHELADPLRPRAQLASGVQRCLDLRVAPGRAAALGVAVNLEAENVRRSHQSPRQLDLLQQPGYRNLCRDELDLAGGLWRRRRCRLELGRARAPLQPQLARATHRAGVRNELPLNVDLPEPLVDPGDHLLLGLAEDSALLDDLGLGLDLSLLLAEEGAALPPGEAQGDSLARAPLDERGKLLGAHAKRFEAGALRGEAAICEKFGEEVLVLVRVVWHVLGKGRPTRGMQQLLQRDHRLLHPAAKAVLVELDHGTRLSAA